MTVIKTYFKVLNKYKATIIMYTAFLIFFSGFNFKSGNNTTDFEASKPDVLVINEDIKEGVTANLIKYIEKNCNVKKIENNKEAINDALFYRDVNYIIYIPKDYRTDFLNKHNPQIKVKSTGNYASSLAKLMLQRYIKTANIYNDADMSEDEMINCINTTLEKKTKVKVTSKLDTNNLSHATSYFNFTNYCVLAGCIYVIGLVLSSFREEKIRKRTIISSMNYKKHNTQLMLSNGIFAFVFWLVYIILGCILIGNIMFTKYGLLYIINSLVFMICTLALAFLIANLVSNKEALNGIVNVLALGTSFLCGAFVPMQWLPDGVLKAAHVFPSYYFIKNNEIIKSMENFSMDVVKPVIINMIIVLVFAIAFVVINNVITGKKRTQ